MARTLDPAAHAVRRDAFVEAADRLIRTKGYEQLSIQGILDELGASKGAFYHYFDSKTDLLEAVIDRMADEALARIAPQLTDPALPALTKLQSVFRGIGAYKVERIDLTLAVLTVWLSDDNAIVRERLRRIVVRQMVPVLTPIIEQGLAEGLEPGSPPAQTAGVVAALIQGASDTMAELYMARQAGRVSLDEVAATLSAFASAFERVLGAPPGSLAFLAYDNLHPWFDRTTETTAP